MMMFQVGAELAPPYSRLVEQEKAGTFEAIKDMRRDVIGPIVAEYHGRIVKLMGDGAIAEFGSVVDAPARIAQAVRKGARSHFLGDRALPITCRRSSPRT
jgi:class 3 adenylate cyclase